MPGNLPFVSVVIPVFNEEQYLADCLDSLSGLDYPASLHEILLIDNGSTDKSLEIAQQYPGVKIHVKDKVKVGGVRNFGVSIAKGTVIIFLDSDCVVREGWLMEGVKKLLDKPNSVLGGQYLLREDPSWIEKYWILADSDKVVSQTTLVGGCIFLEKDAFEKIGGFDETLNAGEDSDLTERLRIAGYVVEIDPSLSVVHLGFPSQLHPFVKRQVWHASDYVNQLPRSLTDKVFIVTLIFMLGVFGMLGSLLLYRSGSFAFFACLTLAAATPVILSAKRISRSGGKYKTVKEYLSIYAVDLLYLIGRSLGVLIGIKNRLSSRADMKISRR